MKLLCVTFLIACLFPYTQFIPIETYTQPYAFLLGVVVFAFYAQQTFPLISQSDLLSLFGLALAGVIGFIIGCFPIPSEQEVKYLLVYVSPLFLTVASAAVFLHYPSLSLRIVSFAALLWLFVGAVQTVYDPNFAASFVGAWQDAAEVVVESGRGVLGLAPEPTHHGFHLLLLGAILTVLGGSRIIVWSCVLGAVVLARSSSAVLALAVGAGILAVQHPFKYRWPIAMTAAGFAIAIYTVVYVLDVDGLRLAQLAGAVLEEPTAILQIDYGVNLRLGGMLASWLYSFGSFLLPHGLSHENWIANSAEILRRFPWLFDISTAGPPSGFGLVIYQLGIFGVLLLARPVLLMLKNPVADASRMIVLAAFFVFMGQYLLSVPGYSVLYAALIVRCIRPKSRRMGVRDNTGELGGETPSRTVRFQSITP